MRKQKLRLGESEETVHKTACGELKQRVASIDQHKIQSAENMSFMFHKSNSPVMYYDSVEIFRHVVQQ